MKKITKITDLYISRYNFETMVFERNNNLKIFFSLKYKISQKLNKISKL